MSHSRFRSTTITPKSRLRASRFMALFLISGLCLPAVLPVAGYAETLPHKRQVARDPYVVFVREASQRFAIPEHWIRAVRHAESRGNPRATSRVGAMGLMQIMPDTWRELRARYRLGSNPYDPHDNILAGTAYLREMFDRYGDAGAMLAAYNAGPGRYDEHRQTGRPLPAETRAYVASLLPVLGGKHTAVMRNRKPPMQSDWRDAPLFVGSPNDEIFAVRGRNGGAP